MFALLPEDMILIITSYLTRIDNLFLSCKAFTKYYLQFNQKLMQSAWLRELSLLPKRRVYCLNRNYKFISKDLAVEVNQYGRRVNDLTYKAWRKKRSITVNGEKCESGIIMDKGPIIKSRDSYYLKYIYDPNNVGYDEPMLNMIVIFHYSQCLFEYVVTKLTGNNMIIELIADGNHKILAERINRSPKRISFFKFKNRWLPGYGQVIKFGGYLI